MIVSFWQESSFFVIYLNMYPFIMSIVSKEIPSNLEISLKPNANSSNFY